MAYKTLSHVQIKRTLRVLSLSADVSYFLTFTREAKKIGDFCTQAKVSSFAL